jgi:hypothetical protein
MKAKLTDADFQNAALWLDVPVAAIKAFEEVESRGDGFLPDGHPVILFERHIMYRRTKAKYGFTRADAWVKQYPELINPTAGGYGKTSEQPGRLDRAAKLIDRECAIESCSWGLFQILGLHWQALGYPTLQAFVNAMYHNEADQLEAFVRFIKINPALHAALKAQQWAKVASGYNGPNFQINAYDKKLAAAFARHSTA